MKMCYDLIEKIQYNFPANPLQTEFVLHVNKGDKINNSKKKYKMKKNLNSTFTINIKILSTVLAYDMNLDIN